MMETGSITLPAPVVTESNDDDAHLAHYYPEHHPSDAPVGAKAICGFVKHEPTRGKRKIGTNGCCVVCEHFWRAR